MMRLIAGLFAASVICTGLALPCAYAQVQQTPGYNARGAVASIANLIDERYFDPQRAAAIAADLRERAQSGAYDHFANPLDLAAALSEFLRPFDGHFVVSFSPPDASTVPSTSGEPVRRRRGPDILNRDPGALARQNYGFRRAEMLPGGIGYIHIDQFADFDPRAESAAPARRAADAALEMISGARAIILDLRDSRGGSPAMVAYLASYFVPGGADVFNTFHSRTDTTSEAPVIEPTGPRRLNQPLYILVNGGTGSASESFPYTLQAARRATIVGQPTNGRANPGGFFPADQGFSVFVSVATPINPITGANWEGAGVEPDVLVASNDALMSAQVLALEALLAAEPDGPAASEVRWVLEAMQDIHNGLSPRELRLYTGVYGEARVEAEDGRLVVYRGRRTPMILEQLEGDLFVSTANPLLRVQFERDGARSDAFNITPLAGPISRYSREQPDDPPPRR